MGRESQYEILNYLSLHRFFGVNLVSKFPLFPPPLFLSILSVFLIPEGRKKLLREKLFMFGETLFQSWFGFLFLGFGPYGIISPLTLACKSVRKLRRP